jgi:hypothetical protein
VANLNGLDIDEAFMQAFDHVIEQSPGIVLIFFRPGSVDIVN